MDKNGGVQSARTGSQSIVLGFTNFGGGGTENIYLYILTRGKEHKVTEILSLIIFLSNEDFSKVINFQKNMEIGY